MVQTTTLAWAAPLFVPGNRPDRYLKAAASGADAIIIDLEDAVAPGEKPAARAALARHEVLGGKVPVIVRLNGSRTPWHVEDLDVVRHLPVAAVMLPKAETVGEVARLGTAVAGKGIIAQIESARGLVAAREMGGAYDALRLSFGSLDFAVDLGCAHTREALLAARSELVLASALHRLARPLDGITAVLEGTETVESDAGYAAMLGFGGKLCVHPKQVAAVMSAFRPSDAEIAWARRVLAAEGEGVTLVDGMMVDHPVREQARRILQRAGHPSVVAPEHGSPGGAAGGPTRR